MSAGVERCPHRPSEPLAQRTNGMGHAYLECTDCGYVEAVTRKADPYPSPPKLRGSNRKSTRKSLPEKYQNSGRKPANPHAA